MFSNYQFTAAYSQYLNTDLGIKINSQILVFLDC